MFNRRIHQSGYFYEETLFSRFNVGQNVEKLGHSLISDRFSLIRYSVIDSVSAVSEKNGGNF